MLIKNVTATVIYFYDRKGELVSLEPQHEISRDISTETYEALIRSKAQVTPDLVTGTWTAVDGAVLYVDTRFHPITIYTPIAPGWSSFTVIDVKMNAHNNHITIISPNSSAVMVSANGNATFRNNGFEGVLGIPNTPGTEILGGYGAYDPPPLPPSGSGGIKMEQLTPVSTWIFAHTMGREPSVSVFLPTGEEVDTDVYVTQNVVTVIFPTPISGFVILN